MPAKDLKNESISTRSNGRSDGKSNGARSVQAPKIPGKRYYTIGDVCALCDEQTHVLRYWEQNIPQLKPNKRRGGRRYYTYKDVVLIQKIQSMLREQGYKISGVRKWLDNQGEIEQISLIKHKMVDLRKELEEIYADLQPK